MKKRKPELSRDASPAVNFQREMKSLRRDLRATLRAYGARLENELESVSASTPADGELSREWIHHLRDLTILARSRRVKPEKGRRKDLRKIDRIIEDLQETPPPRDS